MWSAKCFQHLQADVFRGQALSVWQSASYLTTDELCALLSQQLPQASDQDLQNMAAGCKALYGTIDAVSIMSLKGAAVTIAYFKHGFAI